VSDYNKFRFDVIKFAGIEEKETNKFEAQEIDSKVHILSPIGALHSQ